MPLSRGADFPADSSADGSERVLLFKTRSNFTFPLIIRFGKSYRWLELGIQTFYIPAKTFTPAEVNLHFSSFVAAQIPEALTVELIDTRVLEEPPLPGPLHIDPVTQYPGRVLVRARAALAGNWALEVKGQELPAFSDTFTPRWMLTLPPGTHDITLRYQRDKVVHTRSERVVVPEVPDKLWIGQQYARPDYYTRSVPVTQPLHFNVLAGQKVGWSVPVLGTRDQDLSLTLPEGCQAFRTGFLHLSKPPGYYATSVNGWVPEVLLPLNVHLFSKHLSLRAGQPENIYMECAVNTPGTHSLSYKVNERTQHVRIDALPAAPQTLLALPQALAAPFSLYRSAFNAYYPVGDAAYTQAQQLLGRHGISPDDLYRSTPLTPEIWQTLPQPGRYNLAYFGPATTEAQWQERLPYLQSMYHWLKGHQQQDRAYFFLFDEAIPTQAEAFQKWSTRLRTYFPDIQQVSTARFMSKDIWPEGVTPVPVTQNLVHTPSTWAYALLVSQRPYAHWFLETPLASVRLMFWQAHTAGLETLMYYATNRWFNGSARIQATDFPLLAYRPEAYPGTHGDGLLIFPGPEVLPGLRLKAIRDGLQDHAFLERMAQRLGQNTVNGQILTLTKDWRYQTTDPEVLERVKHRLLEQYRATQRQKVF